MTPETLKEATDLQDQIERVDKYIEVWVKADCLNIARRTGRNMDSGGYDTNHLEITPEVFETAKAGAIADLENKRVDLQHKLSEL